jgi:hypothetical protein
MNRLWGENSSDRSRCYGDRIDDGKAEMLFNHLLVDGPMFKKRETVALNRKTEKA